jgi:hypothetical protein
MDDLIAELRQALALRAATKSERDLIDRADDWLEKTDAAPVQDSSDNVVGQPFAYAYRYPAWPPEGATVIRFGTSGREINGAKPIEAIPLYTLAALSHSSDGVVEAALPLLRQWDVYLKSDLNQMNAHDYLVRYELWNALAAALASQEESAQCQE